MFFSRKNMPNVFISINNDDNDDVNEDDDFFSWYG